MDRQIFSNDYHYQQEIIYDFYYSFSQKSISVRDELSTPSLLSPLWAEPQVCWSDEYPVQCELPLYIPMLVFISLRKVWRESASANQYED